MYTHIYTHTYLDIHVCTHTHTRAISDQDNGGDDYFCGDESCISTHISTHPCLHLHICAHTHAQVQYRIKRTEATIISVATKHHIEYIHAHIKCTSIPLDARLHFHIYTYTSVHTHTHTRTGAIPDQANGGDHHFRGDETPRRVHTRAHYSRWMHVVHALWRYGSICPQNFHWPFPRQIVPVHGMYTQNRICLYL